MVVASHSNNRDKGFWAESRDFSKGHGKASLVDITFG